MFVSTLTIFAFDNLDCVSDQCLDIMISNFWNHCYKFYIFFEVYLPQVTLQWIKNSYNIPDKFYNNSKLYFISCFLISNWTRLFYNNLFDSKLIVAVIWHVTRHHNTIFLFWSCSFWSWGSSSVQAGVGFRVKLYCWLIQEWSGPLQEFAGKVMSSAVITFTFWPPQELCSLQEIYGRCRYFQKISKNMVLCRNKLKGLIS